MMKHFMMAALAVVVVPMSLHAAGQPKVTICHIDDESQYHMITIADPAFDAHMAHGDMNVPTFYLDADGDGFGDASTPVEACTAPPGYVDNSTDCDDTNPAVNPAASEVVDGIDNDCNTKTDDCVQIRLHCDPNSQVLETFCGGGLHTLGSVAAANISYVTFLGDTTSVVLHHRVDGGTLSGATLEIFDDTNLCALPGGASGNPRWNDEVSSVEIK